MWVISQIFCEFFERSTFRLNQDIYLFEAIKKYASLWIFV